MKEILVEVSRCLGCKSCALACAVEHSHSKSLFGAVAERPLPRPRVFVEAADGVKAPLQCRHCEDAPCVSVCVYGAMRQEKGRGVVQHLREKCLGCWMCAMVCPFGVIAREEERKIAVKCDRCPDREKPACVEACPTKALVFAEVETAEKAKRKKFLKGMVLEVGR